MMLHLVIEGHGVSLAGALLLGLGVGYVAGLFGIGGGILLTPLLHVVFGVPLPIAVGTSLCQMVGTALAALLRHRHVGHGDRRVDVLMLPGAVLGAAFGARTLAWLSRAGDVAIAGSSIPAVTLVVEGAYALGLVALVLLFWGRDATARARARPGPLARFRLGPRVDLPGVELYGVSAIALAEAGLVLGFVSGMLGLGGGILMVPLLTYGLGLPMRQAAGTGLLVLVASASIGTVVHALEGHVHLGLAMVLLVGASVTAQLGALATDRVPGHVLKRLFALVVLVTIGAVIWDIGRRLS